jgi:hypothetical protein
MTSSSVSLSPYLQQALREKAERDLAAIDQRISAFDAVDRALGLLLELANQLAQSTPAIAQTAPDPGVVGKLKKLRRAVDDARVFADDIALALDVSAQRREAAAARAAIVDALAGAGLDPATLSPGGEAE